MNRALASFRELNGVGPATEAKLHEAGVYTWQALSTVISALSGVRGNPGHPLGELSAQLADKLDEQDDSERSEAFVLRLSMAPDGTPVRCAVTHVRSQTEQPWSGWPSAEVLHFIEKWSRMIQPRDQVVRLDAGKAIGGISRDIELVVSTRGMRGQEDFRYRATLQRRAYGVVGEASWTTVATRSGRARPPDQLPLRFEGVELPPGVQRLRLRLALELSTPSVGPPVLELA